jgi:hypothetical protein
MLAARLRWLLLVALVLCALQSPLLATAAMPEMAASVTTTAIEVGHATGQPAAEPCCAMQAVPVFASLLPAGTLAVLVVWLLTAWVPRPLLRGLPPREGVPVPGLRGRPLLHAYLN